MLFKRFLSKSSAIKLPIIDVNPLIRGTSGQQSVSQLIGKACREYGFFYITGHQIDDKLQHRLDGLCRHFFAQPLEEKLKIRMTLGGRAMRGYTAFGDEQTKGQTDNKEGIYFGDEYDASHPLVRAKTPLHGPNQFPDIPDFRKTVLDYMQSMTLLSHKLLEAIALSLSLERNYFAETNVCTKEPLTLFQVFNYPPMKENRENEWGIGEHTDYGVLTILKQDELGGLEFKVKSDWVAAPPIAGTLLCNIDDMLDRMTGGLYRAAPHRVRSPLHRNRLAYAFFYDPNFSTEVRPIQQVIDNFADFGVKDQRWDRAGMPDRYATYGDYLLTKVSKAFPEVFRQIIR